MSRAVVLDCDTGSDDAIAIMLAALHPELDLVGVTTVWGNADVDVTTENTLRALETAGRPDVPVFRGAAVSSSAPPALPDDVGRATYLDLPPASVTARPQPAVEWLAETLRAAAEPLTLVPLGPLTNIAAALALDPRIVESVEEIVVMGGSHARTGVTADAERNIWNDAAAAQTVLDAGFSRLVLLTLDATYGAALGRGHARALAELGTPVGTVAAALVEQRIADYRDVPDMAERGTAPVHDPLAVAYVAEPALLRLRHLHVTVEQGGPSHGRTVIDTDGAGAGSPNAQVSLEADGDAYADLLLRTFAGSPRLLG
jgi:purine nucleosidase/ribosylpyrimidine nucleosidase